VAIYCVNCGFEASFELEGHIEFSLAEGIKEGQATFKGELMAELQVGFDAMYRYKQSLGKKHFPRVSLVGWEIPHVIVFGPLLTIDLQAMLEVKAEGMHAQSMPRLRANNTCRTDTSRLCIGY